MMAIGKLIKAGAMALLLAVSSIASASAQTAPAQTAPMVDGVIKELRPDGELTVKHGPLTNLGMGPMTMVFKTSDPKMSNGLKVGDKIKMQVEDVGGKLTIMKLNKAN